MMDQFVFRLAISLGIGLLIGVERERRKGAGPERATAGIRTFSLASLAGGISVAFGGQTLLAATVLGVAALSVLGYWKSRQEDPGLTSEIALLTTTLLGGVAIREPGIAAGFAAIVAILLASRTRIHAFVRDILTEQELQDALLFAGAALVVLPLTPNRPIGPFQVLNPRVLWALAVTVMLISSAGYVALRAIGPRIGLPLAGLTSGFVSSIATIASMGERAVSEAKLSRPAAAGAVLSTVSTVLQMALVLWITDLSTLATLSVPLALSGSLAVAYAALFIRHSLRSTTAEPYQQGRAFNLKAALIFAVTVSAILFASSALRHWLGSPGLLIAAALAGFADTHAVAISTASLVAAGNISAADAVPVIMTGFTTNSISKILVAAAAGNRQFAFAVIPGLILVLAAAWAGTFADF